MRGNIWPGKRHICGSVFHERTQKKEICVAGATPKPENERAAVRKGENSDSLNYPWDDYRSCSVDLDMQQELRGVSERASKQYSLSSVDERLQERRLLAVPETALLELAQYLLRPRLYLLRVDVLPFAVEPFEVNCGRLAGLIVVDGLDVVQGDCVLKSRLGRFCLCRGLV